MPHPDPGSRPAEKGGLPQSLDEVRRLNARQEWRDMLYAFCLSGKDEHAIRMLIVRFDDHYRAGRFAEADAEFLSLDCARLTPSPLVAVVVTAWQAADRLPSHAEIFRRAYEAFATREGHERARRVMAHLGPPEVPHA